MERKNIENILILSLQGIGNILLSTPLLRIVRNNFPEAEITIFLISSGGQGEILRHNPHIDQIILFDHGDMRGVPSRIRAMRALRERDYDLAISTYPSGLKTAIISLLSGAKVRIGHTNPDISLDLSKYLYTIKIKPDNAQHDLEQNLEIAKAMKLTLEPHTDLKTDFFVSEGDMQFAEDFLRREKRRSDSILIGFHPGSKQIKGYKRWGTGNYAELGDRLIENYGCEIIVFGSSHETPIMQEVAGRMEAPAILARNLTLCQTAALIGRCDSFVSHDSGLMHVATSMGVPTVGIFGPTDPTRTAPYGRRHIVVRKDLGCSPCFRFYRRELNCPYGQYRCMEQVTTDEVLGGLLSLLGSGKQRDAMDNSIRTQPQILNRRFSEPPAPASNTKGSSL